MLLTLLPLSLAAPLLHGGTYAPPVPPPWNDGVVPRKPVPGAPGTPGVGPSTPGGPPAAPGPGSGPQTPSGTAPSVEALSWRHWWQASGARWLDVKGHVHGLDATTGSDTFYLGRGTRELLPGELRPTADEIDADIVPALVLELGSGDQDRVTAALVALGKIGPRDREPGEFLLLLERHLDDANQEVAETAALALGLAGHSGAEGTLLDLALDRSRGRTLVGRTEVPLRTRAFATYGLGLMASAQEDLALRQRVVEALVGLVEDDATATHDVPVAAISALALLPLGPAPRVPRLDSGRQPGEHAVHALSLRTQVAWLRHRVAPEDLRPGRTLPWQVRAHGARTLARLAAHAPEPVQLEAVDALTRVLRRREEPEVVHQSAALALGSLVDADADEPDAEARAALLRALDKGQPQVRRFALVSLARIAARAGQGESPRAATPELRDVLLRTLARGKSQLKPWAGLALGVLGRELALAGEAPDEDASRAVRSALSQARAPSSVGAYALAVGLRKDLEGLNVLRDKLDRIDDPLARGDVAIALGLLGEAVAAPELRPYLEDARYRPSLLNTLAVGLALLRDREVVPELVGILRGSRSTASRAAVAAALGAAGDRRAVEPLLAVLRDPEATDGAKAFAAAALGGVADRHRLPWNLDYSEDVNVRFLLPTQSNGTAGLLDIL